MSSSILIYNAVFVLVMYAVHGQDQPSITQIIWPEIKRVGMTGYLNCTVTRQNLNKVFWIRKYDQTVLTSDDRVQVDNSINEIVDGYQKYDVLKKVNGDQSIYTLIVRRLVLSDAGNYTCQVVVTGTNVYPSKDGQLVVLIPPTIIQGYTTQTVTVQEGGNVNLTCAATGYPTPNISWVRVNGSPLPPPYNRYMFKGDIMQLSNVQAGDRGMYRCVADNNVRPLATYDATVYVNFRPISRPIQSSYGQAANRQFDLTIDCIVAGYPPPDMNWYKRVGDGMTPIIDDDRHVINQMLSHGQQLSISEVWYQLTIINVLANDYGQYVCQGVNKLGNSSYNVVVYETSECQGANCPIEGGTVSGENCVRFSFPILLLLFVHRLFQF
jgi:limbic system-associated membrane protein